MMWPRRQMLLWWLVSAAAVAAGTAWVVLRWHVREQHEAGKTAAAPGFSLRSTHDWLHDHLTLTAEQHAALEQVAAVSDREYAACREQFHAAQEELAAAMQASDENSPALAAALEHVAAALTAKQRAALRHYFAVGKVLDDAQRKAFADWHRQRPKSP